MNDTGNRPNAATGAPKSYRNLRRLVVVVGIAWAFAVSAYGIGYLRQLAALEAEPSALMVIAYLFVALFPLVLLWLLYAMLSRPVGGDVVVMEKGADEDGFLPLDRQLNEHMMRLEMMINELGRDVAQLRATDRKVAEVLPELSHNMNKALEGAARNGHKKKRNHVVDYDQPRLPIDGDLIEGEGALPDLETFIRAANFPTGSQDYDGFKALRISMRHPAYAVFLKDAETVLTVLSQEGIYTEDLLPTIAPADLWRSFSEGKKQAEIAYLAGIDDQTVISVTRARLKNDPEFRERALTFQRSFGRILEQFVDEASDAQIERLANTRSGRAYMVLGAISGAFGSLQSEIDV